MKYVFAIAFIVVYAFCDTELGYDMYSPLYTHFTYMFQHSGIVHLALNCIAFIGVFQANQQLLSKWLIPPITIACGFASSFLAVYDIPTVGASAMIYAMIGLYIGLTLFCRKIKITDAKRYLLFLSCVFIGLCLSLMKQNSNFFVHLYSMLAGLTVSIPISIKRNYQ